ncbi:hypothetical protein [Janthinobacterium sp. RB2R34]|uniref:hypothetical protein n=1 Tax=Janthinobacterium sp. RB2R34 TaxID=3424193 RepID=UPI003F23F932
MSLSDHLKAEATKAYIASFENEFVDFIDRLAGIVAVGDAADARPIVQQLVNAYRTEKKWGAVEIPHFNTLIMLIKITGASEEL